MVDNFSVQKQVFTELFRRTLSPPPGFFLKCGQYFNRPNDPAISGAIFLLFIVYPLSAALAPRSKRRSSAIGRVDSDEITFIAILEDQDITFLGEAQEKMVSYRDRARHRS